ncbi:restriction endonuclease subunit S [Klebsiella pneumoniae]|uniref:restriction endonuclease subunit S n=1 Tax=Klebsiella pneumoniae TaxID=573 RepID=UPI0010F398BF|nr:restriction endonuclease subunit S [Klebsiella pneumoniae]VTN94249.1 putative restriction endonuclease S subunit [Klebsiella pneumoniae]
MSEWKKATLAEIADIRVSNVDKKSNQGEKPVMLCNYMDVYSNDYITRDISFMEATANVMEIAKFTVSKGDVLITKDSETPFDIGIPAVVVDDMDNLVCGYHLAQIKPDERKVDSIFLAKLLSIPKVVSYFSSLAAGSTRYGLSNKTIANTVVSLPPLDIQKNISRILRNIDEAIEKTDLLINKYRNIRRGLLHDLLVRGIDSDGRLRSSYEIRPDLYKKTVIGWIPKEWTVRTLGDLTESWAMGPRFSSDEYDENGNVATLRTTDISKDGNINYPTMPIAKLNLLGMNNHILQKNDFVITRSGTCGICAVFEGFRLPVLPGAFLIRFRFKKEIIPNYIAYYLNSDLGSPSVARLAEGGVQKNLRGTSLCTINIPIPSYEEQELILMKINAIDHKIKTETDGRKILESKRKGLTSDLLSPEISVNLY